MAGMKRRLQFSLRNLLWATFSIVVGLSAFAINQWNDVANHGDVLFYGLVSLMVFSPFVAIGALFGHPFRGLLVGLVLVGCYFVALCLALDSGWIKTWG